jgi:type I restriction enzyme S subunit
MTEPWTEVCLRDIVESHRVAVNPQKLGEEVVDHYSLPAFDNEACPERVEASSIKSNKLEVPAGAVLVSRLNPHIPRIWAPLIDSSRVSVCSTEFAVLTPKGCEASFLKYFIAGDAIYGRLGESVNGTSSSHQRVSSDHLLDLVAPLPPRDEQRRIAEVLGALDDRIEAVIRMERLLGQAIIAEYNLALEHRVEEMSVSLLDAVSLVNGGAYTKGADGDGRMVIRIKELNSGPSETTVYSSLTVPEDKTAFPGDVLFAWSGSLGVWRWYRDEAIVNQHIFKIVPKQHPVWLGWIHVLGELERFQDIAAGKATTMGHVTKDHLQRTMVPNFDSAELTALADQVEPLWEAQLQAGREVQTLRRVRSMLLPALVSGELRVAPADEHLEESP